MKRGLKKSVTAVDPVTIGDTVGVATRVAGTATRKSRMIWKM